jgi:hypothetical protein
MHFSSEKAEFDVFPNFFVVYFRKHQACELAIGTSGGWCESRPPRKEMKLDGPPIDMQVSHIIELHLPDTSEGLNKAVMPSPAS